MCQVFLGIFFCIHQPVWSTSERYHANESTFHTSSSTIRAFYHIHILRPWERKRRFYGIFFTHTIFENLLAAIHQIKQDKIHKALSEIVTNRQKSRSRTRATKGGKCVFNSFLTFINAKNENNFKKEKENRDLFTGLDLDSSCEGINI